ncbi:helix-turn-helix domain-containing protein [Kineococcus gynurae]|uniref:Helix-turn-helix domain-containing protein n=1 Tax=Kineococcus gynurae TaxID=452979 RepID=A0ABV5LRY2_9ACTN
MSGAHRGIVYPARLPRFERFPAPPEAADRCRWFWVPRWDLPPGRTSRQQVVGFPALNLVVQSGEPVTVELAGPTTRAGHRDLVGTGWAVGALLRAAAVAALVAEPEALRDRSEFLNLPGLRDPVASAMARDDPAAAVAAFARWLVERVPAPGPVEASADTAAALLQDDPTILRPEDAAQRLGVSVRTLQRLVRRHSGVSPAAMIRRRRLQEALQRIRSDSAADLAAVATELGYADQAHLTNDVRTVLGIPPGAYRRATTGGSAPQSP